MDKFSKDIVNYYQSTSNDEGQRLDNLLIKLLKNVPKSHIYRIIRNGEVRVNKQKVPAKHKVNIHDTIRIPPIKIVASSAPTNTQQLLAKSHYAKERLNILFEDDYFLIINKASGVACHGGSGISLGVIEQLRLLYPQYKFLELAHRLDRDTSGILILAKKRSALVALQNLLQHNKVSKSYLALTVNNWQQNIVEVKAPLYKYTTSSTQRLVKVDQQHGQYAHTIFKVVQAYQLKDKLAANLPLCSNVFTLVEARLQTGRTHQIRVHLAHIEHNILGDNKYGDFKFNHLLIKAINLKRLFLHAHYLQFEHPILKQAVEIKAALPQELQLLLQNNFVLIN